MKVFYPAALKLDLLKSRRFDKSAGFLGGTYLIRHGVKQPIILYLSKGKFPFKQKHKSMVAGDVRQEYRSLFVAFLFIAYAVRFSHAL